MTREKATQIYSQRARRSRSSIDYYDCYRKMYGVNRHDILASAEAREQRFINRTHPTEIDWIDYQEGSRGYQLVQDICGKLSK